MRHSALAAALSLVLLQACGSFQLPPPVEPTPPPEGPAPIIHEPVCVPPGLVIGCWHLPPGEEWEFIPAPVDDATNCDGPVAGPAEGHVSTLGERVNQAILNVYGCDGGRCVVTEGRYLVQRRIIEELRTMGLCAGQHQPGTGPEDYGTDEIAVATSPTAVREGFRVYAGPAVGSGTLILSPQGQAPAWFPTGAPAPPPAGPDPPSPPVAGCSAPLPPKLWTAATLPPGWGEDQIGQPRWEIGCGMHPNGRVIDCTAKVAPQACAYCNSIGMGDLGGQIRCGCPVRNECKPVEQTPPQNFKCEERVACEAYLTGGTKLESRNGATCSLVGGNPFQFEPNGGNCRLCSIEDPRVCGGWF